MINFIDGLLIGTLATIIIYKLYWKERLLKIEKQNAEIIRSIIDKLLANENGINVEDITVRIEMR